jgi:hypothetical protein
MDDIKIIENVIPAGYADAIEYDLMKSKFPWYYIDDVTGGGYSNNSGFAHVAYDYGVPPSDWHPFIKPIVYSIAEANGKPLTQLFRIRVGLLMPTVNLVTEFNAPHVDFLWPHYTACYYATDSDGDTVLFDKMLSDVGQTLTDEIVHDYAKNTEFNVVARCAPKKGTVCIFDGQRFHSSSKPKHHDRRLVITINYV